MDILKAYSKCASAWGIEKMPSVSSISVEYVEKHACTYVMRVEWHYDSMGEPYGYRLYVDKLYFKSLWKALSEKMSEDKANLVFDHIARTSSVMSWPIYARSSMLRIAI